MKKLFVVLALTFPFMCQAQEAESKVLIKECTLGVMVDFTGTHTFGDTLPFATTITITPSLDVLTKHTHDHLGYCFTDNTIQTLHGYLLPKAWDVYCFYSKSIIKKDMYGSVGLEKVVPATAQVEFVFFAEIGTNFEGVTSTSAGLVLHPRLSLRRERVRLENQ